MQTRNWFFGVRVGLAAAALALAAAAAPFGAALAQEAPAGVNQAQSISEKSILAIQLLLMNSVRGMLLFASKGCVACHQINGIGGKIGPALDAHSGTAVIRPLEIAAKMWGSAKPMIDAQERGLGEQIKLTEEELGHIIAFLYDDERQHHFSQALLRVRTRELIERVGGRLDPQHR